MSVLHEVSDDGDEMLTKRAGHVMLLLVWKLRLMLTVR